MSRWPCGRRIVKQSPTPVPATPSKHNRRHRGSLQPAQRCAQFPPLLLGPGPAMRCRHVTPDGPRPARETDLRLASIHERSRRHCSSASAHHGRPSEIRRDIDPRRPWDDARCDFVSHTLLTAVICPPKTPPADRRRASATQTPPITDADMMNTSPVDYDCTFGAGTTAAACRAGRA